MAKATMIVEQGDEAAKPWSLPVAIFIAPYALLL
jgi:hypothetical protein